MKANTKLKEASVKIDGENANKTWEYCLDNFPSPQEVEGYTVTTDTLVKMKRFCEEDVCNYFNINSVLNHLKLMQVPRKQ